MTNKPQKPGAPNDQESPKAPLAGREGGEAADVTAVEPNQDVRNIAADTLSYADDLDKKVAAEAHELFANEPIDVAALYDRITGTEDPAESRALAEAINRELEKCWKEKKFVFKIKRGRPQNYGKVERAVYEGMPTEVYGGKFDKPVEGGAALLKLLFRLGWLEDKVAHQHKGGRMVSINRGVGKFTARLDDGTEVDELMSPDVMICMPTYTEHNFRALTAEEAEEYTAKKLIEWGVGRATATALAVRVGLALAKIDWEENWKGQTVVKIRKNIQQNRETVLEAVEADADIKDFLGIRRRVLAKN